MYGWQRPCLSSCVGVTSRICTYVVWIPSLPLNWIRLAITSMYVYVHTCVCTPVCIEPVCVCVCVYIHMFVVSYTVTTTSIMNLKRGSITHIFLQLPPPTLNSHNIETSWGTSHTNHQYIKALLRKLHYSLCNIRPYKCIHTGWLFNA